MGWFQNRVPKMRHFRAKIVPRNIEITPDIIVLKKKVHINRWPLDFLEQKYVTVIFNSIFLCIQNLFFRLIIWFSFLDSTSKPSTALPYSRQHFLALGSTSILSTALPCCREYGSAVESVEVLSRVWKCCREYGSAVERHKTRNVYQKKGCFFTFYYFSCCKSRGH